MLGRDLLETRRGRLAAFSLLYLSEGVPFGFSAIAITAYLRMRGVGVGEIGWFIATLYAPWGLKWAWAPLVDLIRVRRFGAKRSWIVLAQAMMLATLALLAGFDFTADLHLLALLLGAHNVFAATQDVAIDALAVQVLPEHERGLANGFMFGAFYVGQAIGGSGALYIAGAFGFRATFPFVLAVMTLILLGVSLRLREPDLDLVPAAGRGASGAEAAGGGLWRELGARLRAFFADLFRGFFRSGHGPLVGVVFGLLPAGAVALGLALGNAMQVDLGMDERRIANLTVVTTVLGALGCVTGGWISDRVGHRRALAIWYVLTTLPTFYLATRFAGAAGVEGVTLRAFYLASIAYSFAVGLRYGTSTAVFMGLTSPLVAATQFTGYMALMNVSISLSSLWQGQAAELWGYARVLTLDGLIAFVPLLLLPFLRPSTRGGGAAV